jgi:hypothetical protein
VVHNFIVAEHLPVLPQKWECAMLAYAAGKFAEASKDGNLI